MKFYLPVFIVAGGLFLIIILLKPYIPEKPIWLFFVVTIIIAFFAGLFKGIATEAFKDMIKPFTRKTTKKKTNSTENNNEK